MEVISACFDPFSRQFLYFIPIPFQFIFGIQIYIYFFKYRNMYTLGFITSPASYGTLPHSKKLLYFRHSRPSGQSSSFSQFLDIKFAFLHRKGMISGHNSQTSKGMCGNLLAFHKLVLIHRSSWTDLKVHQIHHFSGFCLICEQKV